MGPETLSRQRASKIGLETKRSVTISRTIYIAVPLDQVFSLVEKQLQETPDWDPTILWVEPISIKHVRVGSMSRVTFRLGGVTEEAVTMVRSYTTNKHVYWTSTHSTQLQEEWELKHVNQGTLVTLTVGYNPTGKLLGRLGNVLGMKGKVEKEVSSMVEGLATNAQQVARRDTQSL